MQDFLTANYHAHTYRCQHAYGTERDYIEAAIEMGIREFGFSDHIPCPFRDGYVSHIRMSMGQALDYVETIHRLAEEYRNDIRIFAGFEAEYIPEFYEDQLRMFNNLGFDYMIMGQHFLKSEEKGPYTGTETSDEGRIRAYVDSVIKGMETGSYLYLAHPDLINYTGLDSVYDWEMSRLCRRMKELDIPLEINVLGMNEGRHYPSDRFWRIPGEIGNRVILGLDAHCEEHVRDRESFEKCMRLVDKFNLNLIDRLNL